jgi:hypothetical protein
MLWTWSDYLQDYGKPFFFGVLATLIIAAFFERDMIWERIMSRRASRKKTKAEYAEVADGISYLLETMVTAGKVRPGTKKRLIREMRKIGLKDIGYEPSFGKPWHFPDPRPSIELLKVQIAERLPKGVFSKFLHRRTKQNKKVTGMFAFMNEIRKQAS